MTMVFQENQRNEVRDLGDVAGAINSEPGMHGQNFVAANNFGERDIATALSSRNERYDGDTETFVIAPTLQSHKNGVRRLTPTECERLQGFPDGWTAIITERVDRMATDEISYYRRQLQLAYQREVSDDEVRRVVSDSVRYRQLGNAVEVDCAEWIARRIVEFDSV